MLGWQYNEKLIKDYYTNHAEDMGRMCAEMLYAAPKAYSDFIVGFMKTVMEKENGRADRRGPSEEGVSPNGAGE
jgi:hypothetical protein